MGLDERFDVISNLKQGEKVYYNGEQYLILPIGTKFMDRDATAVNTKTGMLIYWDPKNTWFDIETRKVVENLGD